MKEFALNIRFANRPISGVERVAWELSREISALRPVTPIAPRTIKTLQFLGNGISHGHLKGHLWEQAELPLMAGKKTVLNLANTGPVLHKNQALLIHDAQVFLEPSAFTPQFRRWYQFMLPRAARMAEHVFTVSNFSKATLEAHGVVPQGKAKVLFNAADHIERISADEKILAKLNLKPQNYFLTVSSRSPLKNLATLISAFTYRSRDSMPLVIAGGSNLSIFADSKSARSPSIIEAGRVSDEELKALYLNARAFLFPSLTEGFGLPPLEAMWCGTLTMVSNAGALPEICGDCAILLPPTDVSAWAQKIEHVEKSLEPYRGLAARARARARQFSWASSARSLIEMLEIPPSEKLLE